MDKMTDNAVLPWQKLHTVSTMYIYIHTSRQCIRLSHSHITQVEDRQLSTKAHQRPHDDAQSFKPTTTFLSHRGKIKNGDRKRGDEKTRHAISKKYNTAA